MEMIPNVTPGEILNEEFLKPMQITAYRLAQDTGMPATRISQILKGRRRITADTALRLSAYFGNSAEFWMGIQDEYELRAEQERLEDELQRYREHRRWLDDGVTVAGKPIRLKDLHNITLDQSICFVTCFACAKHAPIPPLRSGPHLAGQLGVMKRSSNLIPCNANRSTIV